MPSSPKQQFGVYLGNVLYYNYLICVWPFSVLWRQEITGHCQNLFLSQLLLTIHPTLRPSFNSDRSKIHYRTALRIHTHLTAEFPFFCRQLLFCPTPKSHFIQSISIPYVHLDVCSRACQTATLPMSVVVYIPQQKWSKVEVQDI